MDVDLPRYFRGQSLRFVLHFIGDVHQPLHTEKEDHGGNGIEVVFDGKRTNLHSVWDTLMPNKYRKREEWGGGGKESEEEAAFLWAQELYDDQADLASECSNDAAACSLLWASEANRYVCSYVLNDDVDGVQGYDLAGDYYEGAIDIINDSIKKAGNRLAVWVNLMAKASQAHGGEHLLVQGQ